MADKKPAAAADGTKKSDNKLLLIGGGMMAPGLGLGVYEFNPRGLLREMTKEKKKKGKENAPAAAGEERAAQRERH
jgi:hypothetical protein